MNTPIVPIRSYDRLPSIWFQDGKSSTTTSTVGVFDHKRLEQETRVPSSHLHDVPRGGDASICPHRYPEFPRNAASVVHSRGLGSPDRAHLGRDIYGSINHDARIKRVSQARNNAARLT